MLFGNDDSILEKRRRAIREGDVPPVRNDVPAGESILERRARRERIERVDPVAPAPIPETRRRSIFGRRRAPLRDEVDAAPRRRRGHPVLWSLALLVLVAVVAVVGYGYWALAAYHGQMNVLPSIQDHLRADGRRIEAAGQALQDRKASLSQRLSTAGSVLAGRTPVPTQAELDQRTAALQGQINTLQSAQESADQRLNNLQGQMSQIQSQAQQTPVAQTPPAPLQRIDFQANLQQSQDLASGIRLDVSRIDAVHQRYDAAVKLEGGRTVWIHGRAAQDPVKFFITGNSTPNELVVTEINRNSVSGYLQLAPSPVETNSAAGVPSR